MMTPEHGTRAHPIAVATILLAGAAITCAHGAPQPPATPRPTDSPSESLVIQLAFGSEADLDLFVTGPLEETVYFGNTPSRTGGALAADVRCDAPAPRIERVAYPSPRPGRYRIGVDHPRRCGDAGQSVPFSVVVHGPGVRREAQGEIDWGRFHPVVMEFDLPDPD